MMDQSLITESHISWISAENLMFIRGGLVLTMFVSYFGAILKENIVKHIMKMTYWGIYISFFNELLMFLAYFRTYDVEYDNLCKFLFHIQIGMQGLIFVYYWFFALPLEPEDFSTLKGFENAISKHLLPLLFVFVEVFINNIHYDLKKGWLWVFWLVGMY